ncbi:Longin-like domain-containing protein [Polychytrium aggregatum]|uniref:Longin-like domain-containing protein n=1 Tax=Polychytrium aggregatum TaxID=110093 RepID=UPI0022FDF540|nr:Longin-like domain-containing protein [Polychytrium aggregatum]KAI9192966.1 Longin-like domain-containing protein [Polychytrium aggregatum]
MVHSSLNLTLKSINAIVILDSEGKRLLSKYYSSEYPTAKDQKAFEKTLFEKTKKSSSASAIGDHIIMIDNQIVVYKFNIDIFIYIIGSLEENELILASILNTYYEALCMLFREQSPEKRSILENLDLAILALDETIDDGIILESDSSQVAGRVTKKNEGESIPLAEQTIAQALQAARDQLTKSLRQ